jgi:glycosyltransferase involved in cell wall biosynthesis
MRCKISVVMSVFNAELYLKEAIESLLNQTFTEFEFIIINDGSTDSSLEIIQSYNDKRIHVINQENTGLARALNIGIEKSKSNFIARMDADDISLPDRLQKQYEFLSQNPEYVVVGTNAIVIEEEGNYVYTSSQPISDQEAKRVLPNTPFFHPSVMFRKDTFLKAGKYCISMVKAQDTVLFNRMAIYGKFYNLRESLLKYRIVATANSARSTTANSRFSEILQTAIYNNAISDEDALYLKSLTNNRRSKSRLVDYHLYLAKKHLWNNYQPKLARKNLTKSLKIKFNKESVYYYFVSLLPGKAINKLYKSLK